MNRLPLALAALPFVLMVGCGANDAPAATGASSTTAAAGAASTTTTTSGTGAGSTSAPGTTQAVGCPTTLAVVNGAAATETTLKDHPLDVKTAWSDQGPHPDNTVDYDKTLDVAVAEFEIPKSPQFGYSIPIGDPKAPTDKVYLSVRLTVTSGKIAAGQTFVGSTAKKKGDGTAMPYLVYSGSSRLLPGDPTITITAFSDDEVCLRFSSNTTTDLQRFMGLEGSVKVTRIQSLEAADKHAAT
jgi:hypothetical protein